MKITFIAYVKSLQNSDYTIYVNKENIHNFPKEETKEERIVKADSSLPLQSYIYVYDSNLNTESRVLTIKSYTEILPPVEASPSEEISALIIDPDKYPSDIPLI